MHQYRGRRSNSASTLLSKQNRDRRCQHEPTLTAGRLLDCVAQHKHLLSGIIQVALWKGGSCSTGFWQGLKGSQWHSDTAGSVPGCLRAAGESTVPASDISSGLRADTREGTPQSHLSPCSKCQARNNLEQVRGTSAQCLACPQGALLTPHAQCRTRHKRNS